MSHPSIRRAFPFWTPALVAAGAFAVLLAALAPQSVDKDADAKTLTKLDEEWSKAAAAKDIEKVVSYYAEDAVAYPPDGPVAIGKAAAKKAWAMLLAMPDISISWKTAHAEAAASGDLGFTSGTSEVSVKGPDGKPVSQKGKYVCIWGKQKDGSWKAIHDIWNSDAK
jgi:ketosteroid isomerase-like protein